MIPAPEAALKLQATPTSDTAMFYFQTERLGFQPEFLGRVRLVAALASLAGVGVFNFCLKPVPLRKIFLWTSLIGTVLGLSQLLLITGAPGALSSSGLVCLLLRLLVVSRCRPPRLLTQPGLNGLAAAMLGLSQPRATTAAPCDRLADACAQPELLSL